MEIDNLIFRNNFVFYKSIYQIDKAKGRIFLPIKKNNLFEIKPLKDIEIFINNFGCNILDYLPKNYNSLSKLSIYVNSEYLTNPINIKFDPRILGYNKIANIKDLICNPGFINLYELLSFNNGKIWFFLNINTYDYNSSYTIDFIEPGIKIPVINNIYLSNDTTQIEINSSPFEVTNIDFPDTHIKTIYQIYEDEELTKLKLNYIVNSPVTDYVIDISSLDYKTYYAICKYIGKNFETSFSNVESFSKKYENFESTGDISHDYFTSTLDGPPVEKWFNDFTINTGHTVTTTNRCKGLYLHIFGNLTINGTLSMTARGPNCPGQYIGINPYTHNIVLSDDDITNEDYYKINPIGGLGKIAGSSPGINGACGSGGGSIKDCRGGNGTSFSGGAGAGGGVSNNKGVTYSHGIITGSKGNVNAGTHNANGDDYGGIGGSSIHGWSSGIYRYWSGAGAGNPPGYTAKSVNSDDICGTATTGTGGLIILIVYGDIIMGSSGRIVSHGSKGGNAGYRVNVNGYTLREGGGGSGGGAIHIFHKGIFTDKNKVTVLGGAAGGSFAKNYPTSTPDTTQPQGYAGGNGTINIMQI